MGRSRCSPLLCIFLAACGRLGYEEAFLDAAPLAGIDAGEARDGALASFDAAGTDAANEPSDAGGAEPDASVMPMLDVTAIASGLGTTCALRASGAVSCWGNDTNGVLGMTGPFRPSPADVPGVSNAVAVTVGGGHVCIIVASGEVQCWGGGSSQIGGTAPSTSPVTVPGITFATAIDAGYYTTCAVHSGGRVSCWGSAMGAPLAGMTGTIVDIGLSDAIAVSVETSSACAVRQGGLVTCWGTASTVEMGDLDASAIANGEGMVCAVRTNGTVTCWGTNANGELGDGTTTDRNTPGDVPGLLDAVAITAGNRSVCAVRSDRTVVCWGNNSSGQIGNGATGGLVLMPTPVAGLAAVSDVEVGLTYMACAIHGGVVACWGGNSFGALGDGTTTDHALPFDVLTL